MTIGHPYNCGRPFFVTSILDMNKLNLLKRFLNKNKAKLLLGIFAFSFCGFASDGHCLAYYKPAYEGRVVDLNTSEPIEGAVVAALYTCETYAVIEMLSCLVGYRETVTDKDGSFHLYPYFSVTGPLTFSDRTSFIIYKPGYQSINKSIPESCLSSGCDSWGEEKYGVVITGKEIGLQKIYSPKERWRAMPSFSSRDYNRSYDELRSTQMLTEEYEFLASLTDIHSPYRKIFQDDRNWKKKRRDLEWVIEEKLTEAQIITFSDDLLSDESSVYWNAHRKLLNAEPSVVPSILSLLDTVEPANRPRVTKLLGEIGDPSSVDRLCEELLPEHNVGYIERRQMGSMFIPAKDVGNAKERPTPQVTYRTTQKKQTIEDVALALRSFPGQKASQCLVQALPEEPSSESYVSTTLVGFGSLATQDVVGALPGAKPPLKRKLLAILGGIADELALETILAEVQKTQKPVEIKAEPVAADKYTQPLVQRLQAAMNEGSYSKVKDAVKALVMINGPKAVEAMAELLHSEEQRTRIIALWVLSKINDEASRQILRQALKDRSKEAATVALYGLGSIGSLEDLETLIEVAQNSGHPGLIGAAKKSIGVLVYRLGHYRNSNPWPFHVKVAPADPPKKAKFVLRPEFQNLKPGETLKINDRMSYTKPPPSARELFDEEWQKRGNQSLDPNDDSLYVLKIGEARSYKNKYSCTDSKLSEKLAQTYFSRAKEVSQSSNKNLCFVSGVLRNHGAYHRWTISADGTGILFPDAFDDDVFDYDHRKTKYLGCADCSDLF